MSRQWKFGIALLVTMVVIAVETIIFGQIETNYFSAYAACRDVAKATKGYGVWKHTSTKQTFPTTRIMFADGSNDLACDAIGIGPFWIAFDNWHTLVGCVESFSPKVKSCPEGYFGVSP